MPHTFSHTDFVQGFSNHAKWAAVHGQRAVPCDFRAQQHQTSLLQQQQQLSSLNPAAKHMLTAKQQQVQLQMEVASSQLESLQHAHQLAQYHLLSRSPLQPVMGAGGAAPNKENQRPVPYKLLHQCFNFRETALPQLQALLQALNVIAGEPLHMSAVSAWTFVQAGHCTVYLNHCSSGTTMHQRCTV